MQWNLDLHYIIKLSDKKYSNKDFVGKLWIEEAEEIESKGWHNNLFVFVVVVDKSINSVVTISHVLLYIQMYIKTKNATSYFAMARCQLVRRNKT